MSIKIKTISTVQLPPPKCRKNLFHVVLTQQINPNLVPVGDGFGFVVFYDIL